ncbi:hypothetical protein DBR00_02420 [Pseudomonas sp. HMWF032]|uniref:hypothetical protein n=1 Tax=Pseudomonas sp. HMWF032 TaxID=2056866 RepID=UPI000D331792|nr:hypothetical protein [Pseudomonas sp. HMWF032]PTS86429.1 hypothetical protein DBR00_02420 [Pseudomonas sp. HMWF032]PTT81382.1 hypothetical protein DBR41_17110 [Pseudomonas sp. HMWF010]
MSERLIELLGELHSELANQLLLDLENPEKRSPQLYAQIIKFLKDNGIDALPKAGRPTQSLLDGLDKYANEIEQLSKPH